MSCDTVKLQLADLAFGTAPTVEDAAHLRECVECGGRLERERRIASMLRDWSTSEYGPADRELLRTSVRTAIVAETGKHRGAGQTTRFAAAASIAAIALILGLAGLGRFGGPNDRAAVEGPESRAEDSEPGMFTMVGPFTRKEELEPRRSVDTPRRSVPKARRVVRRTAEPRKATAEPVPAFGAADSDSMMRFEFQTEDPKIRIIWFVPRAGESSSDVNEIGD